MGLYLWKISFFICSICIKPKARRSRSVCSNVQPRVPEVSSKYVMQKKLSKEECPKASEFRAMEALSCTRAQLHKAGERGLRSLCGTDSLPPHQRVTPALPLSGASEAPGAGAHNQEQIFAAVLDHFFCCSRAQPRDHRHVLSNGYCENFLMCSFVLKAFLRQMHNREDSLVWFRQCLRLAGQK